MRLCTVSKHVREHALVNPRWVKDAPDTTSHHLFLRRRPPTVSMFWQAHRRTQHHWNRRKRVVGKTSSDSHAAITWVSVRSKGQLWRDARSQCRSLLFAVLPTSKLKHPHHWRHVHARDSAVASAAVLSSVLQFLVSVTRSEVLRDGSIDHFLESFIAGEHT